MPAKAHVPWWSLRNPQFRFGLYLLVLIGLAAWRFIPRPWHPTVVLHTDRYQILSTASGEQTETVAFALAQLYSAYSNQFAALPGFDPNQADLKIKLFRNRKEFRSINPGLGWAEAYYAPPFCRAYYSAEEINPCHWMLHEAVHQLNHEVAHLQLAKWIEEGLAEHFSTSQLQPGGLALGRLDLNTYPVWWIDELATTTNLIDNIANGSVIPLRNIITNRGGPGLRRHFNLYYLHWWSLTRFIFESDHYRPQGLELLQRGGDLKSFEELIGPVESIQVEWHHYVQSMKTAIRNGDPNFFRTHSPQTVGGDTNFLMN